MLLLLFLVASIRANLVNVLPASTDCTRLAWLNPDTAELEHGTCRDERRRERVLTLTRRS